MYLLNYKIKISLQHLCRTFGPLQMSMEIFGSYEKDPRNLLTDECITHQEIPSSTCPVCVSLTVTGSSSVCIVSIDPVLLYDSNSDSPI